jgi:hypothetical protein
VRALTKEGRLRSNAMMFVPEIHQEILEALKEGRTVTKFLFEGGSPEASFDIEFEIVVTRMNDKRLPRMVRPCAR